MSDVIRGYAEHIIYHNQENGYTVLSLSGEGGEDTTLVGNFSVVNEGEYIEAEGEWLLHPTYGQQFRADHARVTIPQSGVLLERYLASGAVKGIGAALASRIMKRFGDDTLRILEEEPERLAEVKGISERKAREIGQQIEERSQMQNALIFLGQYGISLALGIRIYEYYQERLYDILRENPYELAETIQGVGFRTADEIASRTGIRPDSEYRIRSGLLYLLVQASGQGHIYLPKEELVLRAEELLEIERETAEKCLMDLAIDRKVMLRSAENPDDPEEERVFVYTAQSFFLELDTARMLQDLNVKIPQDMQTITAHLERIEEHDGRMLDRLQREAVAAAATHGLVILTGGPGTGKTTTINTMIRYFEQEHCSIALAAPTGRAAKRMTEATGCEASTIHRLLEVTGTVDDNDNEGRFARNEDNPLEDDVIIIDETSMVDVYLMHALLKAIVPGTRLILVGDRNQLPSVGPGSVLRDMIRSEAFPVVTLTHIFRQAQESDIILNAHRIHAGEEIPLDNKSRDFFFLQRSDIRVIQKIVIKLVMEKLPRFVGADPFDIQVLSPMRKGQLGVESLNVLLQRFLNPPAPSKREKETARGIFREGDKVMQIRNDYQLSWEIRGKYGIAAQEGLGVFNGDMGRITQIEPELEMLTVEYDEGRIVEYPFKMLDELELAYAVTVHKAQGSEYPAVVMPLLGVPRMLQTRNLLYTAVTRARKCVVLTGENQVISSMIRSKTEESRYTTLAERIQELH
ncbi:MAG: ATP-dependent RecD-like DNA helicase [Eubacterium sp.]|nr:ATP-dependent RecD-like DNA helicase [Eubacterium sp.]